jgi:hypothetical protein
MRHATRARFDRWAAWRLRLRAAWLAAMYARVPLLAGHPKRCHIPNKVPKWESYWSEHE